MILGHGDDSYRYEDIRINFSSNIYARADLSALQQHLCSRMDVIRTYPEPSALSLERLIARQFGISPDQVLVASGAVDAIYLIAQCYRHLGTCHVVQPTFSEYADACRTFGYHETPDGAVCWLCNPNNPTGNILPPDKVIALADAHHLLVVDQSYEDYTLQPVLQPADVVDRDNIIVLHSMTKRYAVPGLRLGFVTANAEIIQQLRSQYRPWAINALSLEAGKWLIEHDFQAIPHLPSYLSETTRLRVMLNDIPGIEAHETQTNFFVCTISTMTASQLKARLALEHGILIRDASNFVGLTPHHFRLATQSPPENDTLVRTIRSFHNLYQEL